MSGQDYEQLTLFQGDSHANLLVLPGSDEARKMTVTSGLKCSELYKRSGPLGCLVRMCLESSIWHSTRCYLRWKISATPARRSLFQLAVSMPRTSDSESQFWPTVTTDTATARKKRYAQGGMPLSTMLAMFPTPTTGAGLCGGTGNYQQLQRLTEMGRISEEERRQLSQGNGGKANPEWLEWLMGYARAFTGLLPTPRATDCHMAVSSRWWGGAEYHHGLNELTELTPRGRIGLLNPEYVEWLMGYPIGWTESNASETQ